MCWLARSNPLLKRGGLSFLQAPADLRCLGKKDFIDLYRSDRDYWAVGIKRIIVGLPPAKRACDGMASSRTSVGSAVGVATPFRYDALLVGHPDTAFSQIKEIESSLRRGGVRVFNFAQSMAMSQAWTALGEIPADALDKFETSGHFVLFLSDGVMGDSRCARLLCVGVGLTLARLPGIGLPRCDLAHACPCPARAPVLFWAN